MKICPYAKPIKGLSKVKGCEVTRDTLYLTNGAYKPHYRACSNYMKNYEDCPYFQKAQDFERMLIMEVEK